jgi:hypothetical protein
VIGGNGIIDTLRKKMEPNNIDVGNTKKGFQI